MLFDSNVFNMIDWTINGVEPCTGMYIRTIPIASLLANQLQGPALDLALRFNQFNANDYGFGIGWELTLTRVDVENGVKTLILANGQRYRILSESGNTVNLQYKNTLTFNCTTSGTGNYTITYKSGIIEELSNYKISTMTAPNLKKIFFKWNNDQSFLIQDQDQTGPGYMVSSYLSGNDHFVTTPRGTFTYAMSSIRLDAAYGMSLTTVMVPRTYDFLDLYTVTYAVHNASYLYITEMTSAVDSYQHEKIAHEKITTPPGLAASVYAVRSLDFNTSGTKSAETFVNITYTRSNENYTGYPLVPSWTSGVDNAETLPGTFTFNTTDTTDNKRKVLRSYNKFYLLLSEQPMAPADSPDSEKPGKSVKYSYILEVDAGIAAQSSTFMLPVTVENIRQDYNKTTKKLQQISSSTQYSHDEYSNIKRRINPDGTIDEFFYYPSAGSQGQGIVYCPPDPGGFINYLYKKTTDPYNSSTDLRHVHTYTYISIANTNLIQLNEEKFSSLPQGRGVMLTLLMKKNYTYQTDSTRAFYGILTKIVSTMLYGSPQSGTGWCTTTTMDSSCSGNLVSVLTTTKGFDDTESKPVSSTRMEVHAILTGDLSQSTDENNLVKNYYYDRLGRLIKSTFPWGQNSDETATTTTDCSPLYGTRTTTDSREKFSRIFTTNSQGNILTTSCQIAKTDEKGRPITIEYQLETNTYNSLSQLEKSTSYDYSEDKTTHLAFTTSYQWNLFDELLSQANPDKSADTYQYSYLANTISITHQPGNTKVLSTYNDKGALTKRVTTSTQDGKKVRGDIEKFEYDGYWRTIKHTHTQGESLQYSYDIFGRTTSQTGQTSGTRTYQYAPHTDTELVTSIRIDNAEMGLRTYDGLNRETSSRVGNTLTTSAYDNSAIFTQPSKKTITGGRVFEYQYSAALGQPTSRTIAPAPSTQVPSPSPAGSRQYAYHPGTGLLASSTNAIDNYVQNYVYGDFNNLRQENGNYTSQNIKKKQPYTTTITSTIRGTPLKADINIIDPDNANNSILITKKYTYQSAGGFLAREDFFINDQLHSRTNFSRDGSGNLIKIEAYSRIGYHTARSSAGAQYFAKIETHLTYGAFNLIGSKHYNCSTRPPAMLVQKFKYNEMNLLSEMKVHSYGAHSLAWTESYSYIKSGSLSKWKKSGSINFEDPFGHWITSQGFTYSTLGNISSIDTEHTIGRLHISYDYTDSVTLKKITRQALDAKGEAYGFPTVVDYKTDSEGNTIFEASDSSIKRNETTYAYTGETNFSKINKSSQSTSNYLIAAYTYDASDNIVTIEKSPGNADTEVTCRYYFLNEPIVDCIYTDKTRATSKNYSIFHRFNQNTLFITTLSADGSAITYPCFSQPNGSQMAVAEYTSYMTASPYNPEARWFVPAYHFFLQGQNAYGYVFQAQRSRFNIEPHYQYNSATDSMQISSITPSPRR